MVYTDLNPIRAGMADTPDASNYTSIQERIHQYWDEHKQHKEKVEAFKSMQGSPLGTGLLPFADTVNVATPEAVYIPITRHDYFELVDWTGRQVREGKQGSIPNHIKPILERLELDEESWLPTVTDYRKRFFLMVGKFKTLCEIAAGLNRIRFNGKQGLIAMYRRQAPPEKIKAA